MKGRLLLLLLLFMPCITAPAEALLQAGLQQGTGRYYLSEKGNDDNDGKSKLTPWKSLSKLEQAGTFRPGDSILLKRGSVLPGTLSIHGNGWRDKEIYVGAYGQGPDPVIKGSVEVQNWTLAKKNIWVARCKQCHSTPADLFINDEAQFPGRYPNEGYMTITGSADSPTSFSDQGLHFPDKYWNGAEVVVKSSRWTIDNLQVSNYTDKTFHLAQPASDDLKGGFGYFIQNHLSTLDKNGEWFYDAETKLIYLYSDADINTLSSIIEVSMIDTAVKIFDSEFVTVENLSVINTRELGVSVTKSNHVTLRHVKISNSGANGLAVIGCKHPVVLNSTICDSNNNGVVWGDNANGLFSHNAILRTGMYPGRGSSGNGTYIALSITGGNPHAGGNVIQANRIDSTGYSGIDFRTGHTTIKSNLISNFCLIKDDGGGIYTWGNRYGNNSIEGNIIFHGRGSGEGTPEPGQLYTSGIYIDDRSADISVTRNTVALCGTAGIFIHNSQSIAIHDNRLYANGNHLTNKEKGQLLIKRDAIVPLSSPAPMNLDVSGNIFAAIDESNYCLYLSAEKKEDLNDLGIFSRNEYRSSNAENTIARACGENAICHSPETFDLPQWQSGTGLDTSSSFSPLNIEYPEVNGNNLIKNSTLARGVEGWFIWPDNAEILYEKSSNHGPSLKALVPQGGQALLYHAGFMLDKQKTYCLSFSVKSVAKSKLEFVPLAATAPWHALASYSCFAIDTSYRTFYVFFTPEKSSGNARLNFKSNVTFWIDHVSLYEIIPPSKKTSELKLIYNMTAEPRDIPLHEKYLDIDGNPVSGRMPLNGYDAKILFRMK